jgi:hypothetical protein
MQARKDVSLDRLSEAQARQLIARAVEELGGARVIVGSPRHPFSPFGAETLEVDGWRVTVHYGEMSSPAIASLEGWVFEIKEHELVLLDAPRTDELAR